jgi:hypothetical protein
VKRDLLVWLGFLIPGGLLQQTFLLPPPSYLANKPTPFAKEEVKEEEEVEEEEVEEDRNMLCANSARKGCV